MTYHQMRVLFAGLARYDGRLSVLTARSQGPDGPWTVVLRDHVRHTWLRVRRIEQLAADEQVGTPLAPWECPLTELDPPSRPGRGRAPGVLRTTLSTDRDGDGHCVCAGWSGRTV